MPSLERRDYCFPLMKRFLLLIASYSTVAAQSSDAELEQLTLEALKAEQRAKIAAQQKALVEASLPSIPEGPEGSVTTEGEALHVKILAYRGVAQLAKDVASDLKEACSKNSVIAIHSPAELQALMHYQRVLASLIMLETQVGAIRGKLQTIIEPAPPEFPAIPAVSAGVLSSTLGMISLFRSDVVLKHQTVEVKEAAFVAEFAKCCQATVYYSKQTPPNWLAGSSNLVDRFGQLDDDIEQLEGEAGEAELKSKKDHEVESAEKHLNTAREVEAGALKALQKAQKELARLRQKLRDAEAAGQPTEELKTKLAQARKDQDEKETRLEDTRADLSAKRAALKNKVDDPDYKNEFKEIQRLKSQTAVIKKFLAEMRTLLFSEDTATGLTAIMGLQRGERLFGALKYQGKTPYLLSVEVLQAGGAELTRRNFWTFRAPKLFYNGGAIVQFILYDESGQVFKSGVKSGKTSWIKLRPGDKPSEDPGNMF